ncbi:MAG TPA: sensor domain-containing diguanylate cyclase [Nitrococcus sp.]|nr:sensor domain-containing diguanylate cyclase [Nitrococcus sp.]
MATAYKYDNSLELLHHQLNTLVEEARRNEHALRRFQSLELRLMACESLPDLLHLLLYQTRRSFSWDFTTLQLLDPGLEVLRLLEHSCAPERDLPDLIFASSATELPAQFDAAHRPVLGAFDPRTHGPMFSNPSGRPASIALLPLLRNNRIIGSLNLGSLHSGRFRRQCATDFLQHLAAVISVCLEATIIRERLKHLGLTDSLTGVNNRRYFDQRIHEEIASVFHSGSVLSCLLIDIDRFKRINDIHGHQAGDAVLQEVARLIRGQLRNSDVLTRYGGEEFAVLLGCVDRRNALEVAQRIRQAIEGHDFGAAGTGKIRVSVSVGVATYTPAKTPLSTEQIRRELIEQADAALYRAKREGRNRVIS